MIAYYCWTDTLIINALKLKTDLLADEEGDLFVLMLPRVTPELTDRIRDMHCFRKVILIDPPRESLPKPFNKLIKLFRYKYYCNQLQKQLQDVDCCYDRMITGGLWSYTIPMRDLLAGNSGHLPVSLLEEGAANYGGYETAFWCDPKSRFRDKLFRRLFYRSAYDRAAAALDELYLTEPKACLNPGALKVIPFSFLTPAYEQLADQFTKAEDIAPYINRKVSVYLQPESRTDQEKTKALIRVLSQVYGPEQVLVRPHPDRREDWDASGLDPAIYVDRSTVPFECILPHVDWSDKVMVSRASTCLFYPQYGLKQTPYVYFIFNMFYSGDEFLIRKLSERMRALSEVPDHIRIPLSFEAFREMLERS